MPTLQSFKTHRPTLSKAQALEVYAMACTLGYKSTRADWLAVFPNRAALALFRADVGNLCWPGSMGDSPWSFAFSVAYKVGEGFSASSREWYAEQEAKGCPYCIAEVNAVNIYSGQPATAWNLMPAAL